jgi:hypothetical protein
VSTVAIFGTRGRRAVGGITIGRRPAGPDRSGDHAVGEDLGCSVVAERLALEPQPDAVGCRGDAPRVREAPGVSAAKCCSCGPRTTRTRPSRLRHGPRAHGFAAARRQQADAVVRAQRTAVEPAEARRQIGRARAQHRRHVDPATKRDVGTAAVAPAREAQPVARPRENARAARQRPIAEVGALEHGAEVGARDREVHGRQELHERPRNRALERRRVRAIADGAVHRGERHAVDGPAHPTPQRRWPKRPPSCTVVSEARLADERRRG